MSKPKVVLITNPLHHDGIAALKARKDLFELKCFDSLSRQDLMKELSMAEVCITRSTTPLDRELLSNAFRLECIGRAGVGVDNIDLDFAKKRGILVFRTPFENTNSTAEHCLGLILSSLRKIHIAHQKLKEEHWARDQLEGFELAGKEVSIIGLGRIGRALSKKLLALGAKVQAFDPYIETLDFVNAGVSSVDFETALRSADILSIHTPLNSETRGMFGRSEFSKMKPTALVMNAARGGILDEAALLEALDAKQIAFAALDVFTEEPIAFPSKLAQHPRVLATPHLAGQSQEAKMSISRGIAERLIEYYSGGPLRDLVEPEMENKQL